MLVVLTAMKANSYRFCVGCERLLAAILPLSWRKQPKVRQI
jgi:hypothetical protein